MTPNHIYKTKLIIQNLLDWNSHKTIYSDISRIFHGAKHKHSIGLWNNSETEKYNDFVNSIFELVTNIEFLFYRTDLKIEKRTLEDFAKGGEELINSIDENKLVKNLEKFFKQIEGECPTELLWSFYIAFIDSPISQNYNHTEISEMGFTIKMVSESLTEIRSFIGYNPTDQVEIDLKNFAPFYMN